MSSDPPPYTKTDFCATISTNYSPPRHEEQRPIQGSEPPPPYIATVTQVNYNQPAGFQPANSYYGTERPPPTISQPGMGVTQGEPYVHVPDYMCIAIISPFCCIFSGILSIFYASKARTFRDEGQYQTALTYSSHAKSLALWSICIGLCIAASFIFSISFPKV